MKIHANARTCPNSRRLLVRRIEEENWSLMVAAEAAGISERSARKWLSRWRAEGEAGLLDRSSAPMRRPTQLPAERVEAIEALRRLRMTAAEIAETLGMALSTVSRWLKRIGLGKRSRLEPPEPPNRYERKRPGELLHVDIKKLGRIKLGAGHRATGKKHYTPRRGPRGRERRTVGWEFVHVCVDDATRLAYVEVLPNEKGTQRPASFDGPRIGLRAWGSPWRECSQTTALATAPELTQRPAPSLACAISSLAPTDQGLTARRSASSRC
jgi:transposase